MYRRKFMQDLSRSELMSMRDTGMSNADIAQSLGCSVAMVYKLIGKQPPEMSRANRSAARMDGTPQGKTRGGMEMDSEIPKRAVLVVKPTEPQPVNLHGTFMDYHIPADRSRIDVETPEEIKAALCVCTSAEACNLYGCYYSADNDCRTTLMRDALALIERLESERDAALAKVPRWISVEERLPDTTDVYLIHTVHRYNKNDGYRCMDVRLFFKGEFEPWQGLPDIYEVTHWMPLPSAPKEGE